MQITLDSYELIQGAMIGIMRTVVSITRGHENKHGLDNQDWNRDVNSALAELAVAKAFNKYWAGHVNKFKGTDVGEWQVRYTKSDNNRLLIRDADNKQHIFIMVTGYAPTYILQGWIYGYEGCIDKYKDAPRDRPVAYFIPISQLRSMYELLTAQEG